LANKVLVTGCTGLVGHGICYYLLNRGFEVWGTSRNRLSSKTERFHSVQLNLGEPGSFTQFDETLEKIDVVIHSAARRPTPNEKGDSVEDDYFRVNFLGTLELLKVAAKKQIKQFILISGTSLTDQSRLPVDEESLYYPSNSYYSSKIAAEIICQQYHIEKKVCTAILRTCAPYGYRGTKQAVIPKFINLAEASKELPLWGSGRRQQLFTFVEDIGLACELIIKKSAEGIFNITGPKSTTMKELAELILSIYSPSESKIVFTGNPDPQEERKIEISIEKAKRNLGYKPRFTLAAGLRKIKERSEEAATAFFYGSEKL